MCLWMRKASKINNNFKWSFEIIIHSFRKKKKQFYWHLDNQILFLSEPNLAYLNKNLILLPQKNKNWFR